MATSLQDLIDKWRPFFLAPPTPYSSFDLSDITFIWNRRMRSRAGLCKPYEGTIELNPNLLKNSGDVEEIFIHEVCHFAVSRRWPYSQPHGQKWRNLMSLCGREPKRCHTLNPEQRHLQKRWPHNCKCQIHNVTTLIANRIKQGQRYVCRKCKDPLAPSF